jgi:hypothetical protein
VAHAYNPSYSGGRAWGIAVQSQPRQIVCETLSQKHPSQKRAGRVAQDESPEFKPQYCKKKKKKLNREFNIFTKYVFFWARAFIIF